MKNDRLIRFSTFELDLKSGELFKQGRKVKLQGQPFEVLVALLERPGEVLTREELRQRIWPSEVAGDFDVGLNRAINRVREALGDSADSPRFIETVPRRGYRFIGPIQRDAPAASSADDVADVPITSQQPKKTLGRRLWMFAGMVTALVIALAWSVYRRTPKAQPREITAEQLTFTAPGKYVASAVISPDGKYLAYSDSDGIHVKLLATNEERLISRPPAVPAAAFWKVVAWFPDGTQMLANAIEPGGPNSTWTVSVLGESARELRDSALGFAVSPDGEKVAFVPREASSLPDLGPVETTAIQEIWLMGIDGDSPRKIIRLPDREFLYRVHWSPDGKRLAYIHLREQKSGAVTWSIESCPQDGSGGTVIATETGLRIEDFYWLADGRIIYSRQASANTKDEDLWQIGVDSEGKAATNPVHIEGWAPFHQLTNLSATADGKRLVLEKQSWRARVYLGQLSAGGARMSPPRPLTNNDSNDDPYAWTADSKAVLFDSYRNGRLQIFKQDISKQTAGPMVTGPQTAYLPRVSPDGSWILYASAPTAGEPDHVPLMRIPMTGGSPQLVMQMVNPHDWNCSTRANFCSVIEMRKGGLQLTVTEFDPLKGRGKLVRTIQTGPGAYADALAPDGSMVALAKSGEPETHIQLFSLSGGPDREITVKALANVTGLDWSADGRGFYVPSSSSQRSTLSYVDLGGNCRTLWQESGTTGLYMSNWGIPSRNGQYLALARSAISSNAWLIENF